MVLRSNIIDIFDEVSSQVNLTPLIGLYRTQFEQIVTVMQERCVHVACLQTSFEIVVIFACRGVFTTANGCYTFVFLASAITSGSGRWWYGGIGTIKMW